MYKSCVSELSVIVSADTIPVKRREDRKSNVRSWMAGFIHVSVGLVVLMIVRDTKYTKNNLGI